MNLSIDKETWQRLAQLLTSEESPGLQQVFPDPARSCSLLDALSLREVSATDEHAIQGREIHESLTGILDQLAVFESISRCPILAITGLLNAGKSSLLATYLSPANRRRVLRGLNNQAGTHRFVLWLPNVWKSDPQLLSTLVSFLTGLFGHAPEQLSDDPAEAALQYNGRVISEALMGQSVSTGDQDGSASGRPLVDTQTASPLSIPLIAYDEALDDLKVGLVDCPDIQTGFLAVKSQGPYGAELASERRSHLARIGRLCSAFIVVARLNNLHDDGLLKILMTLRDAMPGVPRLLAVNRVKTRYAPDVVYEQARGLIDRFSVDALFTAYDFRSSLAHSRIPPAPDTMLPGEAGEQMPIFFEASMPASSSPGAVATAGNQPIRYLHHLGDRLDTGTLARESGRSLRLQLKAKIAAAIRWIEKNQTMQASQLRDAWQAVADACYEFMAQRDAGGHTIGLRLQTSPAIVAQMADSLQRNAPPWMRISLSIDRTARQLHQAISNSASRLKILQGASKSVTRFAKRFRRGEGAQVVTPQRLAEAIRGCDLHDALQRRSQEQLIGGCELAMKRFAAEDKTLLDAEELDQWSRQVWKGMSLKDKLWKGTQPLAVIMAPLLAAILVPIDGGGTAVLVFASTKELLAAAGIAAVMTPMATGGETLRIVHRETPWRQLSDLFAITCDSLGLPRPGEDELPSSKCDGTLRQLSVSNTEVKPTAGSLATNVWQINDQWMRELHLLVQQLA